MKRPGAHGLTSGSRAPLGLLSGLRIAGIWVSLAAIQCHGRGAVLIMRKDEGYFYWNLLFTWQVLGPAHCDAVVMRWGVSHCACKHGRSGCLFLFKVAAGYLTGICDVPAGRGVSSTTSMKALAARLSGRSECHQMPTSRCAVNWLMGRISRPSRWIMTAAR